MSAEAIDTPQLICLVGPQEKVRLGIPAPMSRKSFHWHNLSQTLALADPPVFVASCLEHSNSHEIYCGSLVRTSRKSLVLNIGPAQA
jgi:hypothetical protein